MTRARVIRSMRSTTFVSLAMLLALALLVLAVIAAPLVPVASADGKKDEEPVASYNFLLEIAGGSAAFFDSAADIGSSSEIIEHRVIDPTGQEIVLKIPGRTTYSDIVLKRGITSNLDAWQWRQQVVNGDIANARRNGTITMLDQDGTAVATWTITNAWPASLTGPGSADAEAASDVAIEELVLAVERIERVG